MSWLRALTLTLVLPAPLLMACGDHAASTGGQGGAGGGDGGNGGMGLVSAGAVLPCEPGELPLDDGSCKAPGVPADGCGLGFTSTGDGSCTATLPAAPCPAGQLALPSETQCRALTPCGTAPWGDIPTDGATVYVDASYGGGGNDGSATKPWTSIQQAVSNALSGALIAVAAGTYNTSLALSKPVRIWGRCPDMVSVVGAGPSATVRILAGADGSELHNLAISGSAGGVDVNDASGVTLANLLIHDTSDVGLYVQQNNATAAVTVDGSLIENATDNGLRLYDGALVVKDSSIRDVQPNSTGGGGDGVLVLTNGDATPAQLTMQHTLVERTSNHGIATFGPVQTLIEDSLLRDIEPEPTTKEEGQAVYAQWEPTNGGSRPTLTLSRSVVERAHWIGVHSNGVHVVIQRSVVRETQRRGSDATGGLGLSLFAIDLASALPDLPSGQITESTIEDTFVNGVELQGVDASFESSIVRRVDPKPDQTNGIGITAWLSENSGDRTQLALRGCRVELTHQGGVAIAGSDAVIEDTAVIDTQPRELDGGLGVGLSVLLTLDSLVPASASIERTVVDGAHGGAIGIAGSDATLTDVVVRNVDAQQSAADFGDGIGASATLVWIPGLFPSSATITRATVDSVPRAGISTFGATVSVADSLLWCNGIDLDGETIDAQPYTFDNGGGNECGCDGELHECRMLSSNLDPPIGL